MLILYLRYLPDWDGQVCNTYFTFPGGVCPAFLGPGTIAAKIIAHSHFPFGQEFRISEICVAQICLFELCFEGARRLHYADFTMPDQGDTSMLEFL